MSAVPSVLAVESDAPSPSRSLHPAIARLQAKAFAAIEAEDWDIACDAYRAINEIRKGLTP